MKKMTQIILVLLIMSSSSCISTRECLVKNDAQRIKKVRTSKGLVYPAQRKRIKKLERMERYPWLIRK